MVVPPQPVVDLFQKLSNIFGASKDEGSTDLANKLSTILADPSSDKSAPGEESYKSLLTAVLSNLENANLSGQHELLVSSTEALGVAARDQQVHEYLHSAGAEKYSIHLLNSLGRCAERPTGLTADNWLKLLFETWRLIANLCADDDLTRETFSENGHLSTLVERFQHSYVDLITDRTSNSDQSLQERCMHAPSQALYNLVGYEPARLRCQEQSLVISLNAILQHYNNACTRDLEADIPLPAMTWDLLEEAMLDWDIEKSPQTLPTNIADAILHDGDAAEKDNIVKAMAAHTKSTRFSTYIASSAPHLWSLICLFYNLQGEEWLQPLPNGEPDFSLMKPLEQPAARAEVKTDCLTAIADVAERDEFITALESLQEPHMVALIDCLSWPTDGTANRNEDLIECVCMILGNYARSDAKALELANTYKLQPRLLPVLQHAEQYSTRVMATRLLKNLAVPEANKVLLSECPGLFECLLPGLKETVRGELLQATISTSRVLISSASVSKITAPVKPLGSDNTTTTEGSSSFLHRLLATASQTDDEGIKIEAGRFLKRLLQCAYRECSEPTRQQLEAELSHSNEHLTAPLAALVTQKQNAVVRSEGWLAMALLAKSETGAGHVGRVLSAKGVWECLRAALALEEQISPVADVGGGDERAGEEQQQPNVQATAQQQGHDRANVRLLLTTLRGLNVKIEVDGAAIDLDGLISSS